METMLLGELEQIQRMSVSELRVRWRELYGFDSRSRNRIFLVRRCCWRLQELRLGGLSDTATARLAELAPTGFERAQIPRGFVVGVAATRSPQRDVRLPAPGTVITRRWHGRDLRLLVREDGGFEVDGHVYGSLTEAARGVTNSAWNGRLFWGVSKRSRKR
jgi:hypothetical protein